MLDTDENKAYTIPETPVFVLNEYWNYIWIGFKKTPIILYPGFYPMQ